MTARGPLAQFVLHSPADLRESMSGLTDRLRQAAESNAGDGEVLGIAIAYVVSALLNGAHRAREIRLLEAALNAYVDGLGKHLERTYGALAERVIKVSQSDNGAGEATSDCLREHITAELMVYMMTVGPRLRSLVAPEIANDPRFPELQKDISEAISEQVYGLLGSINDKAELLSALAREDEIEALSPWPASPGVYVIQGAGRFVKIGKAQNIADRLKGIQTNHPVPIRLLAVLSDVPEREREFHLKFAQARKHGEWFALTPEIRALIESSRLPVVEVAS